MYSIKIHFILMHTIRSSVFKIINQKNCKINFNLFAYYTILREI